MKLEKDYTNLSHIFYKAVKPSLVRKPQTLLYNHDLSQELGIDELSASILTGNQILQGTEPIAQAYAGHQYGHFTMLGDGRAILLGEYRHNNTLYDVQLKGSGQTPYSRRGDGKATLRSMVREYIVSEAMFHLNIPTTRSLAVALTGEKVYREVPHQGAVLTRLSQGHIRVGTFQYAAATSPTALKELADYVIKRMLPQYQDKEDKYLLFFQEVIKAQAHLIANWQSVGFIHGVMNTDNMSIFSETIDYGPCAFMDAYHSKTVFSSIDHYGRYAYDQQAPIAKWNLARLGECLLTLFSQDESQSLDMANQALQDFDEYYAAFWLDIFTSKIGIRDHQPDDKALVLELLNHMQAYNYDFTNSFRQMAKMTFTPIEDNFIKWHEKWLQRLKEQGDISKAQALMLKHNPEIIPRNHLMEQILDQVEDGDLSLLNEWLSALKTPFQTTKKALFKTPDPNGSRHYKTYCGT